jgi:EF-P beta-lysylation protein EpmB
MKNKIINNLSELGKLLDLDLVNDPSVINPKNFHLKAPADFAAKITKNNRHDPLLLQILPTADENNDFSGFSPDPLQENSHMPINGLLHKYQGRALLLLTAHCPINCRFCFRRYQRSAIENWPEVLAYLQQNEIEEIILSGGEPLAWNNQKLVWLLQKLGKINSIARIRIHSRMPIVMPQRFDKKLISLLSGLKNMQMVLVVHCNHPQEIDSKTIKLLKTLNAKNIKLLSHTVLLKGINDESKILSNLSRKLFAVGVNPYYLHLLDRVKGSAHFNIPETMAKNLIAEMAQELSGYLVPKLVRDDPFSPAKIVIG